MSTSEDLGSFVKENKKLLSSYIDLKLEYYKLKLIRMISVAAGYSLWVIVLLFFFFLLVTFLGLVAGFWFSSMTGSFTSGFALSTLMILIFIACLSIFRKILFVNPIIRSIIRMTGDDEEKENISINN